MYGLLVALYALVVSHDELDVIISWIDEARSAGELTDDQSYELYEMGYKIYIEYFAWSL